MRGSAAAWGTALLVVAGCGSDAESPRPPGVAVDRNAPCRAVPRTALITYFGVSFAREGTTSTLPSGNARCTWTGAGGRTVTLDVARTETRNYDSDIADKDGAIAFNRTKPRLGQDSVFLSNPETIYEQRATLSVLSGSNEWHLIATGGGRITLGRQLLALAKTIFV